MEIIIQVEKRLDPAGNVDPRYPFVYSPTPVEATYVDGGLWVHRSAVPSCEDLWVVADVSGWGVLYPFASKEQAIEAANEFLEAIPYWSQVVDQYRRKRLGLKHGKLQFYQTIPAVIESIYEDYFEDDENEWLWEEEDIN